MRSWGGVALAALAALSASPAALLGQDTTATLRHLYALDISRVQPYSRSYDVLVYAGDTAYLLGQRDVAITPATYAGSPAWLLVETRTGIVPAVESLFLAPDMRPVHWSSSLGAARLGAEFSSDSIFGATSTPTGRRSLVLVSRPDLLVSTAMIEALLPLLPLTSEWSDSGAVLAVDAASATVLPAEIAVTGEEDASADSIAGRPTWVVTVRSDRGQMLLWVDKESREVRRVEQSLPAHVGSRLEYRLRPSVVPTTIPPPP